jgi:hypothetical protein
VIGRGLKTGSRYTFAERGPEMITPMSASRGGGVGMQPIVVRVEGAIKNNVIAISNQRGSASLGRRTY